MYLEQFGISTKYNYVIPQFETNLLIFCTVLFLFIPLNTYLSIYPQVKAQTTFSSYSNKCIVHHVMSMTFEVERGQINCLEIAI